MSSKWTLEELTPGRTVEATFFPNSSPDSAWKLRATHLDSRRAPKVVLSNDERIVAGVPCLVRVVAVHKPERDDRGRIEVEYVARAPFRIEGVYLDPGVSLGDRVALMSFAMAVPVSPIADATAAICIHCLGFMRLSSS